MKKAINILGVIVLATVIIGAIVLIVPKLSSAPAATGGTLTSVKTTGNQVAENQELLAVLQSVNSITLNDAILRDPAFRSLSDISLSIARTNAEGRINPFADIAGASAASATTAGIVASQSTVTQ